MGVENKFERSLRAAADELCVRHGMRTYTGEIRLRRLQNGQGKGWACDLPLRLAGTLEADAHALAQELADTLSKGNFLWDVSPAPNGEIYLTAGEESSSLAERIRSIVQDAEVKGLTKIVVNFGAPRGSLRLGQACLALFADTLAQMLRSIGRPTALEFRVDDNTEHMENLGRSLKTRYLKELGYCSLMPRGSLQDGFLVFVARELKRERGHTLSTEYSSKPFAAYGLERILKHWQSELESINIIESSFFLHSNALSGEGPRSSEKIEQAWGQLQRSQQVARLIDVRHADGTPRLFSLGCNAVPTVELPLAFTPIQRNGRSINIMDPRGDIVTFQQALKELGADGLREFALDHIVLG